MRSDPAAQGVRRQLRAVVAADVLGRSTASGHQAIEDRDRGVGSDPSPALDRERLTGVLVDDVQELQDPPVGGLVELEVERPDLVGALCSKPIGRDGRVSEALTLSPALGDPEALLAPDPLHSLAVELPPLLEQAGMSSSIAPAWSLPR